MADTIEYELAGVNMGATSDDTSTVDLQVLPPVDHGKDAYLTLTACFFLEATVWGYIHSYGVMQEYYLQHERFMNQSEGLAAVSTTAMAIMLIGSPFVSLSLQQIPRLRIVGGCGGLAIMSSGLLIASSTSSSMVVLWTQGVMYGIGALLVYFPAMFLIDEWFVDRKGFAFGVSWAGTGIGGASMPFLLQWLLNKYGQKNTLRISAGIITAILLPYVLFMKNGVPVRGPRRLRPLDLSFLKKRTFWAYQCPSIIQSNVAPVPTLWLPSFASSLGMSQTAGPLLSLC